MGALERQRLMAKAAAQPLKAAGLRLVLCKCGEPIIHLLTSDGSVFATASISTEAGAEIGFKVIELGNLHNGAAAPSSVLQ